MIRIVLLLLTSGLASSREFVRMACHGNESAAQLNVVSLYPGDLRDRQINCLTRNKMSWSAQDNNMRFCYAIGEYDSLSGLSWNKVPAMTAAMKKSPDDTHMLWLDADVVATNITSVDQVLRDAGVEQEDCAILTKKGEHGSSAFLLRNSREMRTKWEQLWRGAWWSRIVFRPRGQDQSALKTWAKKHGCSFRSWENATFRRPFPTNVVAPKRTDVKMRPLIRSLKKCRCGVCPL